MAVDGLGYRCKCGFPCYSAGQVEYHRDGVCLAIRRMVSVMVARERCGHREHTGLEVAGMRLQRAARPRPPPQPQPTSSSTSTSTSISTATTTATSISGFRWRWRWWWLVGLGGRGLSLRPALLPARSPPRVCFENDKKRPVNSPRFGSGPWLATTPVTEEPFYKAWHVVFCAW